MENTAVLSLPDDAEVLEAIIFELHRRKNHLFVGNERGGKTAAILASLTSTCRRREEDVQLYLTQLMTNLPDTPISRRDRWLPDRWKAAQAATIPGV